MFARIAIPLVLLAAACGNSPAPAPSGGESLLTKGDMLCEQLFKANETYLQGPSATVDGLLHVSARVLSSFKKLEPPEGDRWTRPLNARWRGVLAAGGTGEELVAPLWEFIGAARVTGLWTCGAEQAALLNAAPRPSPSLSPVSPEEYGRRVMAVIDSTAVAHEEYHHDPDPQELEKRIQPGVADSHGPGYLVIQDRIINGVAALPPPQAQAEEAAVFLTFLRQARAAEAKGIAAGGAAGDAVYELGFFWTSQAIGVACVVWSLDLC